MNNTLRRTLLVLRQLALPGPISLNGSTPAGASTLVETAAGSAASIHDLVAIRNLL